MRRTAGRLSGRKQGALLVGAAALALMAGEAQAQSHGTALSRRERAVRPVSPAAALPDDGLGPRDLLMEAESVAQDDQRNTVTAEGHVQVRYQGRILRADRVIYDRTTGASHAQGHAVIVNPDGTSEYGDDILLDDQFRAGVATAFSARLQQNVTLAAAVAVRRTETVNQLNNAIYTPCNICQGAHPKQPTFSVQAGRIIEDRDHGVIYYKNAVIRVLGVPIFYAPIFWHPDPTTPRRSGFLTPRIEYSRQRGFSYEQPYLWLISPSADLTISPQINSTVNPLLNLHYRQRFYSGDLDVRTGYTYEQLFNSHGKFDDKTSRSYVLADGIFDIDPNWRWGFGAERVTDPTFFRRYSLHGVFLDRGPYPTDTDRLISQLYTIRQDRQSYLSAAVMDFESLRVYGTDPAGHPLGESSKAFPIVAPLVEARFDPEQSILGGRLRLRASAVALSRSNPVISIIDPTGSQPAGPQAFTGAGQLASLAALPNASQLSALTYTDLRRGSLEGQWRTDLTFANGMRLEPFAQARGDIYSIGNSQIVNVAKATLSPGPSSVGRAFGSVGANLSWPFIRQAGRTDIVLEPIAQVAISPTVRPNPRIPNEESVSFEYDETNLFSINRFPGFDLYEGGQRLNLGGRATFDWGGGHSASALVGRTFRAQSDPVFTPQSGLAGRTSDWIVSTTVYPIDGVSFYDRARLDSDTLNVRRQEAGLTFAQHRFSIGAHYLFNQSGVTLTPTGQVTIGRVESADVGGAVFLTKHWGVSASATRDLQAGIWPVAQMGVFYQDECVRLDVIYTHDETYNRLIGASNSISVRLNLATLGDTASLTSGPRYGGR